jgi:hypothetical protein
MARRLAYALLAALMLVPLVANAQTLLLQNFGTLENDGEGPGDSILKWADRVVGEEDDVQLGTAYIDVTNRIVVRVTVQKLQDTTWLLHEVEGSFRDRRAAGLQSGATVEDSGSRRRFEQSLSFPEKTWRIVAWPTGSDEVVSVSLSLIGPNRWAEMPTQIVDAYLALHPSILAASVEDTPAHNATWIRDEMRRLLEYAQRDLGYAQVTTGQTTSPEDWRNQAQRSLQTFATMRGLFYGVGSGAAFERAAQAADQQNTKRDGVTVDPAKRQAWLQARLEEFQNWWAAHQNDPVQFPTATPTPVPPATPTP